MAHPTIADLASKPMAKKKWIKEATEDAHGQFREKAERAGETTRQFAKEHAGDKGKTGEQARLAKTLIKLGGGKKHRSKLYDHPKSHGD